MASRGIVTNHMDDMLAPINNRLDDDGDLDASGIDNALGAMSVGKYR